MSDDNRLYEAPQICWRVLSGPGAVQLGNASSATTTAVFSSEGTYVLQLEAFDGEFSAADSVMIAVKNTNSAPDAMEQNVIIDEDTTSEIQLTATDADGDNISYEIICSPQHGVVSGDLPFICYVPQKDYFGSDVLTFQAKDSGGQTDTAEITITVNPVNDRLTADDRSVSTAAGASVVVALAVPLT